MNRFNVACCLLIVLLLAAGCGDRGVDPPIPAEPADTATVAGIDTELLAGEVMLAMGWEHDPEVVLPERVALLNDKSLRFQLLEAERTLLSDDVAHYSFQIAVGDGPYEVIGLHRVVRERRPYRPIRTRETLFMVHGSPGTFAGVFLFGAVTPGVPDDISIALHLAENGVDVWGIDQSVSLVPDGLADFSFMDDWDLQYDVDNVRIGLAVARFTRLFSGSGFGRLNLLGYSAGLTTGYAVLNEEAGLPPCCRHAGGFIPVDSDYKTDDENERTGSCAEAAAKAEQLAAGIYEDASGALFRLVGQLAQSDPEGPSPIIPGFTNEGALLLITAAPWIALGFPTEVHYMAGVFNDAGLPIDLQYTDVDVGASFAAGFPTYQITTRRSFDAATIRCDEVDVPYDDNLAEVTVPVLVVGAAGGFGEWGPYSASLLGSTDVTVLEVQFYPDDLFALDFGHIDLFTANNAEQEVSQPILEWIQEH